jgi:hypothetical protein
MSDTKTSDESINLRTLKCIDDTIDEILQFGGQVAVYKFSFHLNEWERKEIEGSMFVISRKVKPNYAFVVINRLNTTNMFQTIGHNLDTKLQVPYLLYKNANNEIFCIWFYNESDCLNVGHKLQDIITKLSQENSQSHAPTEEQMNQHKNDIFKRLLSVDLNSDEKSHRNSSALHSNGQNCQQIQIQRRSLQVKDLFESQMASLTITSKPTLPQESTQPQPQPQQNFDDCLLNDVITPAMLTDQRSKPNEPSNTLVQSQSPIIFAPPQQPVLTTTAFGHNYKPIVQSADRSQTVQTLTMEQLKQTLIHLLQTDADFLHSIHNAYIAAVKK